MMLTLLVNTESPNTVLIAMFVGWIFHFHHGCIHMGWMYEMQTKQMVKIQKCFQTEQCVQEISTHGNKQIEIPADFANKGEIEFNDVNLRYRPTTDLVLKNLSFKIKAGTRVGIVGRTAAGKSTMANALCRIVEIENGHINIDGVSTKQVPIHDLREKITVISQEACLFSGSLRFNLDPKGLYKDSDILALLKKAGLEKLLTRDKVSEKDRKEKESKDKDQNSEDQLDVEITEGGANLSSGEKSLLSICRAILRKNKIILLDEATANIDIETETKIQHLINTEFEGCTVLTIAHRLQTIMNSDQIIVMSNGSVKEMGSPQKLQCNPQSEFSKLVKYIQASGGILDE